MPVIPIKVETFTDEHPELRARQLKDVTRVAHWEMGRKWADDLLPEHFQPNAAGIFEYQPRKPGYLKKKRRLAAVGVVEDGGTTPLVFTGLLRRLLTRNQQLVHAQPTRTTIHLIGPSYFNTNYKPGRPQLSKEVAAVSPRHEKILSEKAESAFDREVRRLQAKARRRTK